jgi:hypothetical protein
VIIVIMEKRKKCRKARFGNREEAYFWGPPYHCGVCEAYHITHFDRRILWGRIGIGFGILVGAIYVFWVLLMVGLGFGQK